MSEWASFLNIGRVGTLVKVRTLTTVQSPQESANPLAKLYIWLGLEKKEKQRSGRSHVCSVLILYLVENRERGEKEREREGEWRCEIPSCKTKKHRPTSIFSFFNTLETNVQPHGNKRRRLGYKYIMHTRIYKEGGKHDRGGHILNCYSGKRAC